MRIRTLFVAGLGLAAIPGSVAAIWLAASAAGDMATTKEAMRHLQAASAVQRAVSNIAAEAGAFANLLRQAKPDLQPSRENGPLTDQALARALTMAKASGMDPAPIENFTRELTDLRRSFYDSVQQPLDKRDPALPPATTALRNKGVETLGKVAATAARQVARTAPDLALLIEASSAVMDLRDVAGRRNTIMGGWLGSQPVDLESFASAAELTGRADHAWQEVQRVLAAAQVGPAVTAAVARQRSNYAEGSEKRWREVLGLARQRLAGQPAAWPMEQQAWRSWSIPAQADILTLRDAALDEAQANGEAMIGQATLRFSIAMLLAAVAIGAAISALVLLLRQLVSPLRALTDCVGRIAGGELGVTVPGAGRRDELGEMAGAVETLRQASLERVALAEAQAAEQAARLARGERMELLLRGFEAETAQALRAVAAAATEMDTTAAGMAEIARNGRDHAASVAESAEQASGSVQTVAAATEELTASIAEVARQIGEGAVRARDAVSAASQADGIVRGLSEAAGRIGTVVGMITGIARQTNLLALNATIEAARAGEAGKGFAVVAGEVKSLATQTAKATEQIGAQIASMQTETERTVQAIAAITGMIEALRHATAQVAEAANQQAQATQEIGQAVAAAAQGTQSAATHAHGVSADADRTGAAASDVRNASEALSRQAKGLRGQVDQFLQEVRAA